MLGHKNMNLNIKQCLPAPKNTLTLQAIMFKYKKNYYLEESKEIRSILLLILKISYFQHSEEAWHNPLAPGTSKKSYGTEQVNTYSFPK